MNWTKFKKLIQSRLEDILITNKPKQIGWRIDSNCCGDTYWVWDGFGYHPFRGTIYNVEKFSKAFKNELLKCANDYEPDQTELEKVDWALNSVCWKIADRYADVVAANVDWENAQKAYDDYLDEEPDKPDKADYEADLDAYEEWAYWLEDKESELSKSKAKFRKVWGEYLDDFEQLELKEFYEE